MTAIDPRRVLRVLRSRQAEEPCQRCGHPTFSVLGRSSLPRDDGAPLDTVLLACDRCAAIVIHATGPLDLGSP